ncbi:ethylene-responsive transcription factor ERF084-like [Lolium perenne]|uniref:ethylene-responsive transcription factor ERF084-like n=1 Tax=Lolium perenne TaxID=4522 RepID=UPI0021F64FAF|nr:ethylene-responsive transcription factor ERF098-like [Lolium perenne]
MMLPHRHPHTSAGFLDVGIRPSGCWAFVLTRGGDRLWLDTFKTLELAARAYDAMVWRLGGVGGSINFPDVQSRDEADFLASLFTTVRREEERWVRQQYMWLSIKQTDEEVTTEFRAKHP